MATITMGSADAPVILDPAQIITEVHWGGGRYVAFSIKINRDPEYTWAQEFCDGGPLEPIGAQIHGIYLTALDFISLNANGVFDEARIMTGGGWQDLPPGDVSITGLPSLPPSIGAGYFEIPASPHDNDPDTGDDLDTRFPWGRWQEVSGPSLDIAVPDGGFFKEASSASFELVGQTFTGGPTCYELRTGGGVFQSMAPISAPQALPGTQRGYSISGVTVTARGKTYQPVGIATAGMSPIDAASINPGVLWVLCGRV